jgi:thiamine biosynthesis lipoprotein
MRRLVALLLCVIAGCSAPAERHDYHRVIMGSPCDLVLWAPDQASADAAARAAFARLGQVDEALSDWMRASEVRRLPARAGACASVGPDLRAALAAALAHSRDSDGAFDVTVGPLTQLWRAARAAGAPPAAADVAAARARVGWRHVRLDAAGYAADIDGVQLDFGGIGQGYGADAALQALREAGIACAMVDLSGDVAAIGTPPGSDGWRIALDDGGAAAGAGSAPTLVLADAAVTTSGDRFQHLDVAAPDGRVRRMSHILDPRTGEPIATRSSVTVIARRATDADALATALSVLGPDGSTELLARHPDAAARWAHERPDGSIEVRTTPNWPGPARLAPGR